MPARQWFSGGDYRLAHADQKQWSAIGDAASWSDADNWLPLGVPAATDEVTIDVLSADAQASAVFAAQGITVGGNNASSFTTNDFIYGTVTPTAVTDNALYVKKDGLAIFKGAGTITLKGAWKSSKATGTAEPAFMFLAE